MVFMSFSQQKYEYLAKNDHALTIILNSPIHLIYPNGPNDPIGSNVPNVPKKPHPLCTLHRGCGFS